MAIGPQPEFRPVGNSLTFLRFVLAGMVIYDHACYLGGFGPDALERWSRGQTTSGQAAVEAFFVLSGVLITQSYLRVRHLGIYCWHRVLRIAPAYWVCLAATAGLLPWIVPTAGAALKTVYCSRNGAADYIVHNFLNPRSQPTITGLFTHNRITNHVNGSLWTLKYEAGYYVMVAGIGLLGLMRRPWVVWAATAALYAGLVVVWLPRHGFPNELETGRGLYSSAGKRLGVYYLMGVSWALLPKGAGHAAGTPFAQAILWLGAAGAIAVGWYDAAAPLLMPPLVIGLGFLLPLRRWEKWVGGDYSYGLYIYSYPLQQALVAFELHRHGLPVYLALGFALSLGAAALSWHGIEKRALAWKDLWNSPRRQRV